MANILLLTPQLPYPPHQGTSLRNYHIIRGLAQRHEVTLLSYLEPNQTAVPDEIRPLADACVAIHTVPVPPRTAARRLWQLLITRQPDMAHRLTSPEFATKLRQLLAGHRFDIVQVEGIELARYISTIRIVSKASRIVFDDHNAETELQRRNFWTDLRQPRRWPAAAYSWLQIGRLRRFERWACAQADGVVAVSATDRRHLLALLPADHPPVEVVPNCIDVVSYQEEMETGGTEGPQFDLLFSGKMDYRPNVDAVLWFADAVWPAIRAERPSTTWAIVGQKPHPRLARLRDAPGITVTGWVESVRPYLRGAAVYATPFRIGSGTRLKLIEAMAAGKAIVSTPVGAEGFPVQDEQQLLLAGTPAELSRAVLRLLAEPDTRRQLGMAARQFAQQYDWRRVIPAFDELYAELL